MCPERQTGWVWIFFFTFIIPAIEKWRSEEEVGQRQKVWQTEILSPAPLPVFFSAVFRVCHACCLIHCVLSPTYWHISIDRTCRFKRFCSSCPASFCNAAEESAAVLGHMAGGRNFWATHIPLHQLWGLNKTLDAALFGFLENLLISTL